MALPVQLQIGSMFEPLGPPLATASKAREARRCCLCKACETCATPGKTGMSSFEFYTRACTCSRPDAVCEGDCSVCGSPEKTCELLCSFCGSVCEDCTKP